MVEPILTLTSSIITLITTIAGVLTEKSNIEKEEKINNSQSQDFRDIQTKGDNSPISITATQTQQSVLIKNHQEYKIRDKKFKENLSRLKVYNKCFLIACPIIAFSLIYFKQIDSFSYAMLLCVVAVNSYSISLFFKYIYRRYVKKIKGRGEEQDLPSRIIRRFEHSIFPVLIFAISSMLIWFSISSTKIESESIHVLFFFICVYMISLYTESLLYQFVIGGNIWIISAFLKRLFVVMIILIIVFFMRDIYNWLIAIPN